MIPAPDDTLLAAYADDPAALAPAEHARVEAWLADGGADADPATVAAVRALPTAGTAPDWRTLEERVFAATTRAPHRHAWRYAAVALVAAAAVAFAVWPRGRHAWPALPTIAPVAVAPAPAVDDAAVPADLPVDDEVAVDDDSDLGGMGAIDDHLIDQVAAFDDEDDEDDAELPALGARWTAWLDTYTDAELDRALAWLDSQEAG